MAMTNELRENIVWMLQLIEPEYEPTISYKVASDDAMYPHVVYDLVTTVPNDMGREDYVLDIHIWDKFPYRAYEILDAYKEIFAFRNDPSSGSNILPTFYETSSGAIDDPDKTITHLVLRLQVQVYQRTATDRGILERS